VPIHPSSVTMVTLAVFVASSTPITFLSAQVDGTPIRLQTAAKPGKWITGQAVGITDDSVGIILEKSGDTLRYARADLQRMDVSVGRKSNVGRGAVKGAAIVGGFGLVLGVACVAGTDENDWAGCEGSDVALFTVAGAATGAALGALLGSTAHQEMWQPVELEVRAPENP
jgi:hypothetical protein